MVSVFALVRDSKISLENGLNVYTVTGFQASDKVYIQLVVSDFQQNEMVNYDQNVYSHGQELWISEHDLHMFKLVWEF